MDFEIPATDEQLFDYEAERERVRRCLDGIQRMKERMGRESRISLNEMYVLNESAAMLRSYAETLAEAEEEEGR